MVIPTASGASSLLKQPTRAQTTTKTREDGCVGNAREPPGTSPDLQTL